MADSVTFTAANTGGAARLDRVIRDAHPTWGRAAIKALLHARRVSVNGKTVWMGSWRIQDGDQITISEPPEQRAAAPQAFDPAWLVAETEQLVVVNKPSGLRVQAAQRGDEDHLEALVSARFGELRLVHRLDRDTSGLVLFARPAHAFNAYLDAGFKSGAIHKAYLAVVAGTLDAQDGATLHDYIEQDPAQRDRMTIVAKGGKVALTDVATLGASDGRQLLRLMPRTGRTHQLRVQLASRGAPILGDRLYGDAHSARRLMLHAARIVLPEEGGFAAQAFEIAPGPDFVGEVPDGLLPRI